MHTNQQLTSGGATKGKQNKSPFFPQYVLQAKLQVNEPGDSYEREADAMAEQVMRMTDTSINQNSFFKPAVSSVQRKCQHCEEEEMLNRKESSGDEVEVSSHLDSYVASLGSSGQPLPETSREFFEPRFGHDFSNVRVHNDPVAAKSAQSINALAYTTGNNIVFNNGLFSPGSDSGKRLMAHELTHIVQQGGGANNVQRKAASTSCTANSNSAPADPAATLQAANDRAVLMSLGTSLLLFSESLFIGDPAIGPSSISTFFHRRFGDPAPAPGGRFTNRFTGTLHASMVLAQSSEMQFVSDRLERISHLLDKNIHFKCADATSVHIGDCAPFRCGGGNVLGSCPTVNHGFDIAVCSVFWGLGATDLQAIGMIHEASHMLFHFGDHDTAPFAQTAAQRRAEPECYASMVADIYGSASFDPSCPIIP
jgi:Domain of unknown function (DUF4157)